MAAERPPIPAPAMSTCNGLGWSSVCISPMVEVFGCDDVDDARVVGASERVLAEVDRQLHCFRRRTLKHFWEPLAGSATTSDTEASKAPIILSVVGGVQDSTGNFQCNVVVLAQLCFPRPHSSVL